MSSGEYGDGAYGLGLYEFGFDPPPPPPSPPTVILTPEPFVASSEDIAQLSREIEQSFIDESPPSLFPENQDSNFGILRKNFCDTLADVLSQIDLLYNERWPDTSYNFFTFHEEQVGLPISSPSLSLRQRQELVFLRYQRGPFTPTLRNSFIEFFIAVELAPGAPVVFTSLGVPILSGLQLFSGIVGSLTSFYQVVENVESFSYTVYIDSSIAVDTVSLTRELKRITPAGITFTIVSALQKTRRSHIIVKSQVNKSRIVRSRRRRRAKITHNCSRPGRLAIVA